MDPRYQREDDGHHRFYPEGEGEVEPSAAQYLPASGAGGLDPSPNPEDMETMEEAGGLGEMQGMAAAAAAGAGSHEEPCAAATSDEKAEVDARSIYVGNVDYACQPEEVQQHFQSCGTVNRVTILSDKFGQPKGFAYVEFVEADAVQNALLLNETELHGRPLKVCAKRTNIPGMKQSRGRRPFRGRPFMAPPPFYSPYGYGKVPRFRRPARFRPYY